MSKFFAMWKKIALWKKIVMGILVICSAGLGFGAAKVQVTVSNSLGKINRDIDTSLNTVNLDGIKVHSDDEIVNILLIGDDYREYDGSTSPGLYDVIMIATMDKKHGTLKLSSIMRDTLVEVAGQDKYMKINASGKKEYGGIKNLYKTIALNFNIKVDGYAKVGFDAFKKVVDAVDGVEVELTETEVKYLNHTNYIWKKKDRKLKVGKQTLNGNQALGYCRIRKGMDVIGEPVVTANGLTDDYGRTWRQRTLLTAVFDKMKTQPLSKWVEVANNVLGDVTTDLDDKTIMTYMKDVITMGTMEIKQFRIPMDNYYYDDRNNEFPDAQGWSLVPTTGNTHSYDPAANAEALKQFIFDYNGKEEFHYSGSSGTSDEDTEEDSEN
ncbi:MAG: LCP family protein [Eubacteriales bacterium]|nr:LCP family protein [Eubacteriales bacterium]